MSRHEESYKGGGDNRSGAIANGPKPDLPGQPAGPSPDPSPRVLPILIREPAAGASAESPGVDVVGKIRKRSVDAVLRPERPQRVLLSQCALRISRSHDPGGMAF